MLKWFQNRRPHPSPPNHELVVKAVAARAQQQVSWQQIQTYLRNRDLSPEQLAQWMTRYGGLVVQGQDRALGEGLVRLGQIAEGELAVIAKLLGEAIMIPSPVTEAEAVTADPAPQPLSTLDSNSPNPEVLDQVEAYLRGDFSFTDPEGPNPFQF